MGLGVAGAHGAFVSGLNSVGSGGVEPRRLVPGCGGRWVVVVVVVVVVVAVAVAAAAVAVAAVVVAVAGRANGFNAKVGRVVGRTPAHGALVFSMIRGAGGGWWCCSDPTDDSEALASAAAASSSAVSVADHRKMFPK